MPDPHSLEHARALDAADPLARFRGRFYLLPNTIYMDGNSLGLPRSSQIPTSAPGSLKAKGSETADPGHNRRDTGHRCVHHC